jgi:hypothetical protein
VYSKCGFKAKFKGIFVSVKSFLTRYISTILSRTYHTRKRYAQALHYRFQRKFTL